MEEFVATSKSGSVAKLTICRPQAMNALNDAVLRSLLKQLDELAADSLVRVIVISGQGERAFIAGADISEFLGADSIDALEIAHKFKAVADRMTKCVKPVVGAINGFCLGGGFEIALACDLRIASSNAVFGVPEIKLGIIPGGGAAARLTRAVGASAARALAMTGDTITAERAFQLGLVSAVYPIEEFAAATDKLAQKIASYSPFALAQLKSVFNVAMDTDVDATCAAEMSAYALCYSTADQKEGSKAFLEKRTAHFTGR
jgi:enoyl-CoA hydratase